MRKIQKKGAIVSRDPSIAWRDVILTWEESGISIQPQRSDGNKPAIPTG